MNYKISVIIPCYNAESTLNRCIKSVINQTFGFENIELILYDDASTDSTKEIIENYAKKYKNIVPIYSNENSGFPVRGRNEGIKIANSEYIMFMDNDDEYDLKICEFFHNIITESNPDLISCGKFNLDYLSDDFTLTTPEDKPKINIKKEDIIYFEDRFIWNKIYKRTILIENQILFPENKYAEDLYFNIMYLLHCNSLIDIPDYKGYIRHVQEDSISRSWNLEDMGHILDVSKLIYSKISSYPNIDFSRLYKKEIGIIIYKLYSLHLLNNKKEAIEFLKKIHDFEKNISFTGTIDKIQNIANRLLLKKRYNLCYYYLKIIERTYSSNRLRKLYRKTN